MNKKTIIKKAQEIYSEKGQSAVFDFAKDKEGIKYEFCSPCETNSPSIDHECLVCGSKTTSELSEEEKVLLELTLNEAYNMRFKLVSDNSSLISNEAREKILEDANKIDDLRIKLIEILRGNS